MELASYVGNCVNSFDGLGECVIGELPWYDVSAFACSEESAEAIDESDFYKSVNPFKGIPANTNADIAYLKTEDGVFVLYDRDADVHYFFV